MPELETRQLRALAAIADTGTPHRRGRRGSASPSPR